MEQHNIAIIRKQYYSNTTILEKMQYYTIFIIYKIECYTIIFVQEHHNLFDDIVVVLYYTILLKYDLI